MDSCVMAAKWTLTSESDVPLNFFSVRMSILFIYFFYISLHDNNQYAYWNAQ